jgi:hypothetical protein
VNTKVRVILGVKAGETTVLSTALSHCPSAAELGDS